MNPATITAPLDVQRQTWDVAAEMLDKAGAGMESLETLLTAEVGQTDSETVYTENKLELHHYEPDEKRHETPLLVIYALVNRPYILDLQPDRSVIRRLLEDGYEVYLIDWGEPSTLDQTLTMDDYVNRYIDNCVDVVLAEEGVADVHLLGYCMGGSMAIMYTALHQERVRTLGLMATPFKFNGCGGVLERWATHYDPDVAVETLGNMPSELLAFEFSMMDPIDQYVTNYVRLYENAEDQEFVANWARMERWVWDGVDIAGEAYREFINDIYRDNQLMHGEYDLAGQPIRLGDIEVPLLQIVGEYDHIVPSESSEPINDLVGSDDETLIEFPRGHIGISVSGRAHDELWPQICEWYAARDAGAESEAAATDDADGDEDEGADVAAEADVAEAEAEQDDETAAARATVEAVAEKTAQAARAAGPDADSNGHSALDALDGIGPTYAERLSAAGIETTVDLARYDAAELADIAEAPLGRVEGWLEQVDS